MSNTAAHTAEGHSMFGVNRQQVLADKLVPSTPLAAWQDSCALLRSHKEGTSRTARVEADGAPSLWIPSAAHVLFIVPP